MYFEYRPFEQVLRLEDVPLTIIIYSDVGTVHRQKQHFLMGKCPIYRWNMAHL